MQENCNILIIGNGFDLAHGLPTTYSNFLDFGEKVNRIFSSPRGMSVHAYEKNNLLNWKMHDDVKAMLKQAYENKIYVSDADTMSSNKATINKGYINELHELITDNVWFKYFLECRSKIGKNWIDFESEMSRVIQALDEARLKVEAGGAYSELEENVKQRLIQISKNKNGSVQEICDSVQKIDEFTDDLNRELTKLIRALEIYISEVVEKIEIHKKSPDIEAIHVDYVLSFNYSNTFERVYGLGAYVEYDYIHGKADISHDIYTNNMVLGIDEYLDDERKNTDVEFIAFKKFYQRIFKQSIMKVTEWCSKIKQQDENAKYSRKFLQEQQIEFELATKNNSEDYKWDAFEELTAIRIRDFDEKHKKHQLYILGHSLDVTDKDILRDLILNDNVQTTIYYYSKDGHDKADLGDKIANLTKVIGEEELIKRTSEHTIIFKKQQEVVDR